LIQTCTAACRIVQELFLCAIVGLSVVHVHELHPGPQASPDADPENPWEYVIQGQDEPHGAIYQTCHGKAVGVISSPVEKVAAHAKACAQHCRITAKGKKIEVGNDVASGGSS
jgi:hypothetical protein